MATGVPVKKKTKANYTDIFSTVMVKLAARHPDVVAITAAMPDGTGLKRFRKAYPERFFDVGIAEEHAVTFAALILFQNSPDFLFNGFKVSHCYLHKGKGGIFQPPKPLTYSFCYGYSAIPPHPQ